MIETGSPALQADSLPSEPPEKPKAPLKCPWSITSGQSRIKGKSGLPKGPLTEFLGMDPMLGKVLKGSLSSHTKSQRDPICGLAPPALEPDLGNPEPSPSKPVSFRGPSWPLSSRALDSHPSVLCCLSIMLRPLSSNCLFLWFSPSRSRFTTRKVSSLSSCPEAEPMSQGVVSQLCPLDPSSQAQAT